MKTATKAMHTPGPWKHFDGSRFITGTYNGIDTPLAEICVLPRKDKFPGYDGVETLTDLADAEMQLNAQVLAAAPDMLEALELEQFVEELKATHDPRDIIRLLESRGDYESGHMDPLGVIDHYQTLAALAREAAIAKAKGGAA